MKYNLELTKKFSEFGEVPPAILGVPRRRGIAVKATFDSRVQTSLAVLAKIEFPLDDSKNEQVAPPSLNAAVSILSFLLNSYAGRFWTDLTDSKTSSNTERGLWDLILGQTYCSALARTFTSPLDNCKIAQQLSYTPNAPWWSNLLSFADVGQAMKDENWFLFFFKGNGAAIWRVLPYVTIRALVGRYAERKLYFDGPMLQVISNSIAVFLTHPLDTVKNRLTAQSWNSYYHGTWHALYRIGAEEGVAGLWAGWVPAVVGVMPFEGLAVYINSMIQRIFIQNPRHDRDDQQPPLPEDIDDAPLPETSAASFFLQQIVWGISSCLAQSISIPLDLVKKRLQLQSPAFQQGASWPEYEGMLDGLHQIIKQEGYSALFKGVIYNHVKTVLFGILQRFILNWLESRTQILPDDKRRRYLVWIYLVSVTPLLGLEAFLWSGSS